MEKYIPFEIDGELYYSTKDAGEIMGFEENTIIRWAVMGSDTFSYEKVDKNRSIKNYCWGATLVDMYFSDPDGFAYIIENREKNFRLPEDSMDFVFVIRKDEENQIILERYSEGNWEEEKLKDSSKAIYVTKDASDSEISKYNISEIIWKRFYDSSYDNFRKITVSYTPDNITAMERKAAFIWLDYYMEERDRLIEIAKKQRASEEIHEKHEEKRDSIKSEYSCFNEALAEDKDAALKKWVEEGMVMPAPSIISKLKKEQYSELSWKDFKNAMKEKFQK